MKWLKEMAHTYNYKRKMKNQKCMEIEIKYKYDDDFIKDCLDEGDDGTSDCIRLCEIDEDDVRNNLLNYDEEIVTGGAFYIEFDNYLEEETKKYYDIGSKTIKLGELLKLVYDEYCIYENEGKILYHTIGELMVENVWFNTQSKTFMFFIGS